MQLACIASCHKNLAHVTAKSPSTAAALKTGIIRETSENSPLPQFDEFRDCALVGALIQSRLVSCQCLLLSHPDLKDLVKLRKRSLTPHFDPPPDGRGDIEQEDIETMDGRIFAEDQPHTGVAGLASGSTCGERSPQLDNCSAPALSRMASRVVVLELPQSTYGKDPLKM